MTHVSPGRLLRDAVQDVTIQIPGAFNALAARMVEEAGFDAVYLSGAALSAGVLALPDVGLFSITELAQQTAYLTRRVKIPVIVDADTGFGAAVQVERTIVELELAGAAAIQLEDQMLPKRCGHLSGKQLVEPAEMCAKLRAAVAARANPNLVLLARTDARGVNGLADAIDRAKRYLDAGADWIFPEALADRDEFERFAQAVDAPLVANMTEFGQSPLLGLEELADLGFAAVIYPVTLMRVAMKAVEAALAMLANDGTQVELIDLMQSRQELYDLLGYKDYEERDRRYFTQEPSPE
jgi:methylisocitrate lyase